MAPSARTSVRWFSGANIISLSSHLNCSMQHPGAARVPQAGTVCDGSHRTVTATESLVGRLS